SGIQLACGWRFDSLAAGGSVSDDRYQLGERPPRYGLRTPVIAGSLLRQPNQKLILPFRMFLQTAGAKGTSFALEVEGRASACRSFSHSSDLRVRRAWASCCALRIPSLRCVGLAFSTKRTVAHRKWAPSDVVTRAFTDFSAPSGNSRCSASITIGISGLTFLISVATSAPSSWLRW